MTFLSVTGVPRPVRLSEQTRAFAARSLAGEYGDDAMKTPAVSLDDIPNFAERDEFDRYDAAIRAIAERAPLRLVPGETVAGAATLGSALDHVVPALFGGNPAFFSVSHVTLGFDRAVREGLDSFVARIGESRKKERSPRQKRFLESLANTAESMRVWHARYLAALEREKSPLAEPFARVPFAPARNFREAVMSLWFCFAFTRLTGNWPGIGRIDALLGPYLERDLAEGTLTLGEAREILAGFFIKGCEWIRSDAPAGSGDAQHYQNIVLAGTDEEGREIANAVTYLVLDIVEELGIGDFPVTVRLSPRTPAELKRRAAEVVRLGGGIVAFYNEDLVVRSLTGAGYALRDARRFANDGCWEIQIPGETYFIYSPFDCLRLLLDDTLGLNGKETPDYPSFVELKEAFFRRLDGFVAEFTNQAAAGRGRREKGEWVWAEVPDPASVVSLFTADCIERARSYYEGGPNYTVLSPHIGGAPDAGNSLYALKKLVYDEKRVTLRELKDILRRNWEGAEPLRVYARTRLTYYGNDCDESDALTAEVLDRFAASVAARTPESPVLFPPGVSTFGRQIEWAPYRSAVPFGFRAGEVLSANGSPTPGTDVSGATALLRSYAKADLARQTSGAALDLKLLPSAVRGEKGRDALVCLLDGFVATGGFFVQPDVIDSATLREAQKNPDAFRTLSVRVSGWNARFATLSKEWQDMVIARTEQGAP